MASSAHNTAQPPSELLHHETLGSTGPVVVMLHGWAQSLGALRPVGELLAEHCQVIMLDLPGFGRSPLPPAASNEGGGWDTAAYAGRVMALLDSLSIANFILVGHSFGGRISVRIASSYPDRALGMVLIGAPGVPYRKPFKKELRARYIKALASFTKKVDGLLGTRFFAHYLSPRFGSRDYIAAGDLKKTFVKTVNENLTEQATRIQAPALLLWGEHDQEAPVDIGRRYRQLIGRSKLIVLPQHGHEPFNDVGSHLITTHIEAFLSEVGVTSVC